MSSGLTLNAPIATKVVFFSRLLKCFRSLFGKQYGPRSDCSYRSSVMLGNYLQQTTSADIIFRCIFLGALRVNPLPPFHDNHRLLSFLLMYFGGLFCKQYGPLPPFHDNHRLLSFLLMYFGGLFCKQYGPRSDCSFRSSLIRSHSVCSHNEISLECI